MAANTRYHLLPEDNRPSLDSNAGDNERLLRPLSDEDDTPPKKILCFSFHPTFITRSVVFILLVVSVPFIVLDPITIPSAVIVILCIIRNFMVLASHIMSRCIHVRIEFVKSTRISTVNIKHGWSKSFTRKRIQIAIDLILWLALFLTVTITGTSNICGYRWYNCLVTQIMAGMILNWVAM